MVWGTLLDVEINKMLIMHLFFFNFLIDLRERERNINLLFHSFMYSLVGSCMCPDLRSNLKSWHIKTMLSPTELSSQGDRTFIKFTVQQMRCHVLNNMLKMYLPLEFQFYKMKRVLEIGCTTTNAFNTTELYTIKLLRW